MILALSQTQGAGLAGTTTDTSTSTDTARAERVQGIAVSTGRTKKSHTRQRDLRGGRASCRNKHAYSHTWAATLALSPGNGPSASRATNGSSKHRKRAMKMRRSSGCRRASDLRPSRTSSMRFPLARSPMMGGNFSSQLRMFGSRCWSSKHWPCSTAARGSWGAPSIC